MVAHAFAGVQRALVPSLFVAVLLLVVATLATAQESEDEGPALFGDGGGRVWKWSAGEKTFLTPEGLNLVLGGVGEETLWGWTLEGDQARLFTLALPKMAQDKKKTSVASPVFQSQVFPIPERADWVGDRVLLLWGTRDGHPRYEVWKGGERLAARAWDDGRSVYGQALGPVEGWLVVGRLSTGLPWLEVSGSGVPSPEGWRGRLTVAAWVAEKETKTSDAKNTDAKSAKADPVVRPSAAGWGSVGKEPARPLFWGPDGWRQPAPEAGQPLAGGVYPVLGSAGDQGSLVLGGWQADEGTGALRPWFWDGEAAEVPGGTADGQPQAFSAGGKGGAFLVVRHQSAPYFTLEDGKESKVLEGLGPDDRVVAVEAAKAAP